MDSSKLSISQQIDAGKGGNEIMPTKQKGGGARKIGRNKVKAASYRASKALPNKRRKLKRHMDKHPNDGCAQTAKQKVG